MNNGKGCLNWFYHLLQKLLQLFCRLVEFFLQLSVVAGSRCCSRLSRKHMETEIAIAELCILWKERGPTLKIIVLKAGVCTVWPSEIPSYLNDSLIL